MHTSWFLPESVSKQGLCDTKITWKCQQTVKLSIFWHIQKFWVCNFGWKLVPWVFSNGGDTLTDILTFFCKYKQSVTLWCKNHLKMSTDSRVVNFLKISAVWLCEKTDRLSLFRLFKTCLQTFWFLLKNINSLSHCDAKTF